MTHDSSNLEIDRRTFVKGLGVATGVTALGAGATPAAADHGFETAFANVRVREARKVWERGFRGRADRTIGLTDSGVESRHPDLGPWNGVNIEPTDDGYELQRVGLGSDPETVMPISESGVIEPGASDAGAESEVRVEFNAGEADLLIVQATWDQGQSAQDLDLELLDGEGNQVASSATFGGPESIRAKLTPQEDYTLRLFTFASGPTTYEISGRTVKAGLSVSSFSGDPVADTLGAAGPTPKTLGWFGAEEQPLDGNGHGTHVASIMGGSGRASQVADAETHEPQAVLAPTDVLSYEVEAEAGTGVYGSAYGEALELAIEGPDGRQLDRSTFQEDDPTPHDDRTALGSNAVVDTPTVHDSGTATYTIYVRPLNGGQAVARCTRVSVGSFARPADTPGDREAGDGVALHTGVAPNAGVVGFQGLSGATAFVGNNAESLAADFNLRAVNMSWGTIGGVPTGISGNNPVFTTVEDVKNIAEGGILTVAAAGNSNTPVNSSAPAIADEAISVVATDPLDGIVDYSSGGSVANDEDGEGVYMKPDVTAPGGGTTDLVNAAKNGDPNVPAADQPPIRDHIEKAGTSMASPYVNGTAALVAEAMEVAAPSSISLPAPADTTFEDVMRLKQVLLATASETAFTAAPHHKAHVPTYEHGGRDPYEGFGRVNPDAAVDAVSRPLVDTAGLAPNASESVTHEEVLGLDVPEDSRAVAGFVDVGDGELAADVEFSHYSGGNAAMAMEVPHLDLFVYDAENPAANGEPNVVTSAMGVQGSASVSVDGSSLDTDTVYVVAKLVNVPGAATGLDVRAHFDLNLNYTAPPLPAFTVGGARSDDGSAFTKGATNNVTITVSDIPKGVSEISVTDSVPEGWTVSSFGDAQNSQPVEGPATVDLGTVSAADVAGDSTVEKDYFVEATGDSGQYTFGPAEATIEVGDTSKFRNTTDEFGGTDTNTIVGANQNDAPL